MGKKHELKIIKVGEADFYILRSYLKMKGKGELSYE